MQIQDNFTLLCKFKWRYKEFYCYKECRYKEGLFNVRPVYFADSVKNLI